MTNRIEFLTRSALRCRATCVAVTMVMPVIACGPDAPKSPPRQRVVQPAPENTDTLTAPESTGAHPEEPSLQEPAPGSGPIDPACETAARSLATGDLEEADRQIFHALELTEDPRCYRIAGDVAVQNNQPIRAGAMYQRAIRNGDVTATDPFERLPETTRFLSRRLVASAESARADNDASLRPVPPAADLETLCAVFVEFASAYDGSIALCEIARAPVGVPTTIAVLNTVVWPGGTSINSTEIATRRDDGWHFVGSVGGVFMGNGQSGSVDVESVHLRDRVPGGEVEIEVRARIRSSIQESDGCSETEEDRIDLTVCSDRNGWYCGLVPTSGQVRFRPFPGDGCVVEPSTAGEPWHLDVRFEPDGIEVTPRGPVPAETVHEHINLRAHLGRRTFAEFFGWNE